MATKYAKDASSTLRPDLDLSLATIITDKPNSRCISFFLWNKAVL